MRPRQIHYLRNNERESSPVRLLIFDTETRWRETEEGEIHTLRLWAAEVVERSEGGKDGHTVRKVRGKTADELADLITQEAKNRRTLWVFAHNLGFDLAVTRLPLLLIDRGWKLTMHALVSDAPWARMAKGSNRIVIADSFSWLPTSVEQIGHMVGVDKPALPEEDDSDEAWYARCEADVTIVRRALVDCMDWWDRERLGNWSITGPVTGWNCFRHMPSPVQITIKPDDDAIKFEREALMGGRRETWFVGELPSGYYADIDFVHAHLTVCAQMRLPYRRYQRFESLPLDSPLLRGNAWDVLAECEIETYTPRYPVRFKHGICYPTGRFKTILAGPEIREAMQRGELRSIGKGYVYAVAHTMRNWGMWMIQQMENPPPDQPPVVQVMLKGWSRTVPGRWALRTSYKVQEFPDPRPGWRLEDGWLMPGFVPAKYLTIGGTQHVYLCDQEADDSFPAVLVWIQSWTRVMLGRLVDALGSSVLQANTDGCVVDAIGIAQSRGVIDDASNADAGDVLEAVEAELQKIAASIHPIGVRVKRYARRLRIVSAQHVQLDEEMRFSGVPKHAREVQPLKFAFKVWPKLPYQIALGRADGYVQHRRVVDLSKVPVNRWRMKSGACQPVETEISGDGTTRIKPPPIQWLYEDSLAEDDCQHPDLRGLQGAYVNIINTD